MRKVLTFQNVCFLSLTNESLLKTVVVTTDALHEGESEDSMPLTSENKGNSLKKSEMI